MSNYNSAYADYKQYNNSDISKPWNYDMQPIPPPIISETKTNSVWSGPNPNNGKIEHPSLKNAYRFWPGTETRVTRPLCGGGSKRENYRPTQNEMFECNSTYCTSVFADGAEKACDTFWPRYGGGACPSRPPGATQLIQQ